MIEVEKKVKLSPALLEYLDNNGTFLGEKAIEDTYYDTPQYSYTTKNIWFRKRCGGYELKRPIIGADSTIDRYEEITEQTKILDVLKIKDYGEFEISLKHGDLSPFATFVTHRKKYKLPQFDVDVDMADFGDFTYGIAEVECLVKEEDEIHGIEDIINSFLQNLDIDITVKPPAKLTAYLQRCKPDHYHALKSAGIVR